MYRSDASLHMFSRLLLAWQHKHHSCYLPIHILYMKTMLSTGCHHGCMISHPPNLKLYCFDQHLGQYRTQWRLTQDSIIFMQKVLLLNFPITRQRKLRMGWNEVINNKTVLLLGLIQMAIPTNVKDPYTYVSITGIKDLKYCTVTFKMLGFFDESSTLYVVILRLLVYSSVRIVYHLAWWHSHIGWQKELLSLGP